MSYQVTLRHADPALLAAACGEATRPTLVKVMMSLIGETWDFVKRTGLKTHGLNVAIYRFNGDGSLSIEAGVLVPESFEGDGRVKCSTTPSGPVAVTTHIGPYHLLGGAYDAIHAWCDEHSAHRTGVVWEIYGHWNDDPAQLRTEVFSQLSESKL